jgi:hypothetical protein
VEVAVLAVIYQAPLLLLQQIIQLPLVVVALVEQVTEPEEQAVTIVYLVQ